MNILQVDERVKRLLEAWTEWSILSPNFLLGLEFAFVESDADMKAYLSELESINRLTKRDPTDDVAEFESLQRQAKLNGVFVAPSSTVRSLRVRLEYCRRYQLTKSGGKWQAEATYLPATQTLKPTGDTTNDKEYSIDDDLDGIHVDIDTTDAANMYSGDDEDIDGVPMDVPRSRDVDHVDTNVEDIDGLPLDDYDDVDGIAMDN